MKVSTIYFTCYLLLVIRSTGAAVCKGRYFVLYQGKLSKPEAQKYCQTRRGNLASISDEATQNQINSQANNKVNTREWNLNTEDKIWAIIGGVKSTGTFQDQFEWLNGIKIASKIVSWSYYGYNNWYNNSIQGSGECMALRGTRNMDGYSWKWNTWNCDERAYYICEYQSDRRISINPSAATAKIGDRVEFELVISLLPINSLQIVVSHDKLGNVYEKSNFKGSSIPWVIQSVRAFNNGIYHFKATSTTDSCALEAQATLSVGSPTIRFLSKSPLKARWLGRIEVVCECSGFWQPDCTWSRENTTVAKSSFKEVYQQQSTPNQVQSSSMLLVINGIYLKDAGEYVCSAANWYGDGSKHKVFVILVRPTNYLSSKSWFFSYYGESKKVLCVSYAYPKTHATWTRDGNVVPVDKNYAVSQESIYLSSVVTYQQLTIRLQDVRVAGVYVCKIATNEAGEGENLILNITVKPNATLSTSTAITEYGKAEKIACTSFGYPIPEVFWTRQGANVSINTTHELYQTTTVDQGNFKKTAFLSIKAASIKASGRYLCEARGHRTTTMREANVLVRANITLVPSISRKLTNFSETLIVDCISYGWRNPTVAWYKNSVEVTNSNSSKYYQVVTARPYFKASSRLHISVESLNQLGTYKCQANNINSTFTAERTLQVQAKANITISDITNTSSGTGNKTIVECIANGYPTPYIYWTKDSANVSTDTSFNPHQVIIPKKEFHVTATLVLRKLSNEGFRCHAGNTVENGLPTFLIRSLDGKDGQTKETDWKESVVPIASVAGVIAVFLLVLLLVLLIIRRKRKNGGRRGNERGKTQVPVVVYDDIGSSFSEEENPYGEVEVRDRKNDNETKIDASSLERMFRESVASNHAKLNEQFARIKVETANLHETNRAKKSENLKLNRYKNIIPYDVNYVPLHAGTNDYVNASFIEGFKTKPKWIATQGPTSNTVNHFWLMACQQNSGVVVMLANLSERGKRKCEKYWPDLGMTEQYGPTVVRTNTVIDKGCFVIRRMSVEQPNAEYANPNEPKEVVQFHFTAWPDHGVPATTSGLLRFYNEVNIEMRKLGSDQTTIVHCSAGAGRTGTFIGLDYLLNEMNATGCVDVYRAVLKLREQRMEMVQTVVQYVFLHKLLYETSILSCTDDDEQSLQMKLREMQSNCNNCEVSSEFKKLGRMIHDDRINSPDATNRFKSISVHPVESYNRHLTSTILAIETGENAAHELWNLVAQKKIDVIVRPHKTTQAANKVSRLHERQVFGNISVTVTQENVGKTINQETFTIESEVQRQVTQFEFNGLADHALSAEEMLDVFARVGGQKSILVYVDGSNTESGALFCISCNLLSRFKTEKRVDICRAWKDVQDCVPRFVSNKVYYQALYSFMATYAESFSNPYVNFST